MKHKTIMRTSRIIALGGFLSVWVAAADAQVNPGSLFSATSERATSTNYYFAQPNELTIVVNVMGFVQRPGRYEISNTIDLINLLALAGGPTADGTLSDVKVRRMTRKGEETWYTDFAVDLDNVVALNTEANRMKGGSLMLSPGDVVSVGRTGWSTVRDVFGVVLSAAVITTAVAQVISLSRDR